LRFEKRANVKGAGFADDLVEVSLMRRAFLPEGGPLTDMTKVIAERKAEMALLSGAIGHAKNHAGHRDVNLPQKWLGSSCFQRIFSTLWSDTYHDSNPAEPNQLASLR
jgi:hypothetical protein